MSASSDASVPRFRDLARQLHRQLTHGDDAVQRAAATRLCRLRGFAALSLDALLAQKELVQRKHALAVIATEHGYASWLALLRAHATAPDTTLMYTERLTLYLNRWFADYDEAKESLLRDGGYLLPYRKDFFITEAEGIRELGLDPLDPDCALLGCDFARPRDEAAHARLLARRQQAIAAQAATLGDKLDDTGAAH